MSFIQNIRDKYARVAVIAIALALLGFILMDAFTGKSKGLFSGNNSNSIGKINGQKIDYNDFLKKVDQMEAYQKSQGYYQGGEGARQQIMEGVWGQEVTRILMTEEIDKLGIRIGKRELNDMLFGANPPEDIKRLGTDQQTGQYSPAYAQQRINQIKKSGTVEDKEQFNLYISEMEFQRMQEKYNSLLSNASNFPRWMIEKQNADKSQLAKISFVRKPYSEIPDSSIKITDEEIKDYIGKHKNDFKQEESRSVSYVLFSAAPTAADSLAARQKLLDLKAAFDSTKDAKMFLASQGMQIAYDGYISGKMIQHANKDSIFKIPVGRVYGPYLDGPSYNMAKLLGVKQQPDTVKVRHILISTAQQNQQTGQMQQVRDSASARKLIDSVQGLIKSGQPFDSVCAKFSEDGTKDKGGVYDKVVSGQMVGEFNDFIFTNPAGTKGVVQTMFGFHYIEIISQKGSSPAYKIAYLPSPIIASTETDNNASNQANLFAGDSRDQKSFDANYEKNLKPKGINKSIATDIKPNAGEIMGLGASRTFVREIYKASLGEVLQPQRIGEDYVVAAVIEVNKEGTQSAARARNSVEPVLRNKKKAEQIKKQIGTISTLEAVATALVKPIETADSLRMTGPSSSSVLGYEPKVSGVAFNPVNKGKVITEAIEGQQGVYVVRVDNVSATAVADANVAEQRKAMYQQAKQGGAYGVQTGLRKAATISDKRADRF